MANELSNQFQMLRARIENSLQAPYAILVSSALETDGKAVCAQGLAESMAAAGYRTLYVDLDHEQPTVTGVPQVKSLATTDVAEVVERCLVQDAKTGITALSLSDSGLCATGSKDNVGTIVAYLRPQFDAIVVNAAPLIESSIGVLFANECQAVILTTREGRSVRSEDRALLEILEREGSQFFGVVTVGVRTINEFEARSFTPQVRYNARPVAARKVDSSPLEQSLVR